MKKIAFSLALCASFAAVCGLSGCDTQSKTDGLDIVCTTFPQYDWVRTITEGDDSVNLTILETTGQDLHNFQPSAADIVKIYQCDLFIYVGGESDEWADEVLSSSSSNPERVTIDLVETLGNAALVEEEVPGAEQEDHDHDHDHGEIDEHVWLSLKNAVVFCRAITNTLCELNPDEADLYRSNSEAYCAELSALDAQYEEMVESAARKTVLFGDRFPFRYLAEDYGLTYYAAFSGCSAETEASFSVITNLAAAVDENELPCILLLETSDQGIAVQVRNNTKTKDQEILVMNSIQSVTGSQIENGASYLTLMQENLKTLEKALN